MSFEDRFRNTIKKEKAKNKKEAELYRSRKQRYKSVLKEITPSALEVCKGLTKVKRWKLIQDRWTTEFGDDIPIESCPGARIDLRYPKYLPRFIADLLGMECDKKITVFLEPPFFHIDEVWDEVVLQVHVQKYTYNERRGDQWVYPNGDGKGNRENIYVNENSNKIALKDKLAELLERAAELKTEKDRDNFGFWDFYIDGEKVKRARIEDQKLQIEEDDVWIEASSGKPTYR